MPEGVALAKAATDSISEGSWEAFDRVLHRLSSGIERELQIFNLLEADHAPMRENQWETLLRTFLNLRIQNRIGGK
jgi:hypothetical protein